MSTEITTVLIIIFIIIIYKVISRKKDSNIELEINDSGDNKNPTQSFSEEGKFSYNIQLAHFNSDEVQIMGKCTYEEFQSALQNFEWENQLEEARKIQKVSPTIAVRNNITRDELSISVVEKKNNLFLFYIFYLINGKMYNTESLGLQNVNTFVSYFFNEEKQRFIELFD